MTDDDREYIPELGATVKKAYPHPNSLYQRRYRHLDTWIDQLVNMPVDSMLDIGGGPGFLATEWWLKKGIPITVIDIWNYPGHLPEVVKFIQMDALDALERFGPQSLDSIQCTEVLEHMSRSSGYQLIRDIKRMARKVAIITTPNGPDYHEVEKHGNPHMKHISAWFPSDLRAAGYEVILNGGGGAGTQIVAVWKP